MARNGRGPNGRALKMDGTERKARRTLSATEKAAQAIENARKAAATIGKKLLADCEGMDNFNSGLSNFSRWVAECKNLADPEKREKKRAYLQAQIDSLDEKAEVAENWLPEAEDTIQAIVNLHSSIGDGYQKLYLSGDHNEESIVEMIKEIISEDIQEMVESGNDPDADPLAEFRRGNSDDDDNL